jgi:hypothetical protein
MIVFPRVVYYGLLLTRLVPRRLMDTILARIHVDIPEHFDPPPG